MNDNDWKCADHCDWRDVKGLTWRMTFSAVSALGWFGFVIAWLFFLAGDYGLLQNIGVLLLSVVALAAMNAPVWISFAKRMEGLEDLHCPEKEHGAAKAVLALAWMVAIGLWLLIYAGDFSLYQNLAVLLLSLVPVGAANLLLKLR